ncbi:hypothetical protein KFE25_011883 [Diacronema lutheri]|uniref:PPM-type phosphatase domain-containing protein n=1 Tax=Diacronema lutheri TaxID=2081491 RepID=A0A8J5XBE6_DIALT|nr:hypothetical protein KFE25_011883 [Diacronema lutheri]
MLAQREAVRLCSVFDGHSPHGQDGGTEEAERAAAHFERFLLNADVWAAVGEARRASLATDDSTPERLHRAITTVFVSYQRALEAAYDEAIRKPLLAEKARLEAEIEDSVQLEMPQEGGTTATLVVCAPEKLICAWVGDSEAVVARVADAGAPLAVALTLRKHQPSDEAEHQRAIERGGSIVGGICYVKGVQGGLRVTRSLGDCALHDGGVISAAPDVHTLTRTADDAFLVIASDGLWDGVSFARAIELTCAALRGCGKHGMKAALVAARQALIAEAVATQSHPDDVVVVIHLLNVEHGLFRRARARRRGD